MPRRWIDPDLFTDEKLGKASLAERHLFTAMVANQDDDGRLLGHPGYLRSIAFPYDNFSNEEVSEMRDHLAEVNTNVIIYQNAGDEYIQLKRHYRYQRPRYYHPSKYPALPGWPFKDEQASSNAEVTAKSPESGEIVQQPKEQAYSNHATTTQLPQSTREATARYTEDRVGVGLGGVGSDLDLDKGQDTRMPSASVAADDVAGAEKKAQGKPKTRLKPRQQEAGIFLDMVEKDIGVKLVERPMLIGKIRNLLVKQPEATSEHLLECFKWLKQNDPYCRARDSPATIKVLPSKYPEWAAGKLKPQERGETRESQGQRVKGSRPASDFTGEW